MLMELSILLESYCNWKRRYGTNRDVPGLSILLESYCNTRWCRPWSCKPRLSILLESYCNENFNALSNTTITTFNSPRVLLQHGVRGYGYGQREVLSILLESYCNMSYAPLITHAVFPLSILLESYCNDTRAVDQTDIPAGAFQFS